MGWSTSTAKSYVIVMNHRAMIDIPALYFLPLNFRWVSKREVFRIPFFGQFLRLHGDICIDRGHAAGGDGAAAATRAGCGSGAGRSVAIFRRATRSKDGRSTASKAGLSTWPAKAGWILPVVLDGTASLIRPADFSAGAIPFRCRCWLP